MQSFSITRLLCNHVENPLGLDRVPQFGWKMQSDIQSDRQTAYRITVKNPDGICVWDSGLVKSKENACVHYEGEALKPRTRYTWHVCAENTTGAQAEAEAWFETGKLDEQWQARWITAPWLRVDRTDKAAPYFRKTFALNGRIKSARLYLCGLGYAEAFIEGEKVGCNLLEPAFTRYDALTYYRVYDVTELLPESDKATIGVVLGNGWYNCITEDAWNIRQASWRAVPKLLAEMHIEYADGHSECVCSDRSWQTGTGAIVFNSIRNGETYDARLACDDFSRSDFNAVEWKNAVPVRSPGGALVAAEIQPVRVMGELKTVRKYRTEEGHWIFDLGQNFAGKVRLKAYGAKDSEIILRYSEDLNEDGTHVRQEHLRGFVRSGEFQTDRYIKKSDDVEEWTPQFVYHGFRYVEVEGLPSEGVPDDCITGLVMHASFAQTGTFACSDEALSTIQRLCHWSSISNCQSVPTDSPHREKNAWTGDTDAAHGQLLINYDSYLFLAKWLIDVCNEQRPNGSIPCVCPSTGWGYNWGNGPDWSMVLSTLPWALYKQSGDLKLLERVYPHIARHFDFMTSMAEDGVVSYGIGDWCAPFDGPAISVNMEKFKAPVALTDTTCYYRSAMLLSKMSRELGLPDPYLKKGEEIRETIIRRFIDKDTGEVDGSCQTSDGCIAYAHLLSPEKENELVETLVNRIAENGYHLDFGILGSKYVLRSLGEHGRTDVIYKMLTRDGYPGFMYLAKNGQTTLSECWNLGGSHNHYMFSDVSAVMYEYIAGIRRKDDATAYSEIVLAPALHLPIKELCCTVETPHGKICSAWKKDGSSICYTVDVPFGTTATLRLPKEIASSENGETLGSGHYTFCF